MTKYEVMAILSNALDEAQAKEETKNSIVNKIKELGGTITFEDFWGTRGFAYMIKGEKWGYYFVVQFEIDGTKINELKRDWNIDKNLTRFMITSVDPKAPAPRSQEEIKKEWDAMEKEKKISEAESPKKGTRRPAAPAKPAAPAPVAEKAPAPAKEAKPAPKKDDVDKKLDAILEDSSLDL